MNHEQAATSKVTKPDTRDDIANSRDGNKIVKKASGIADDLWPSRCLYGRGLDCSLSHAFFDLCFLPLQSGQIHKAISFRLCWDLRATNSDCAVSCPRAAPSA